MSNQGNQEPRTNSASKRVRFEDQPNQSNELQNPTALVATSISPISAARAAFVSGSSALHANLRESVTKEAKQYAELLKLLRSKEKSLRKYDDEAFMPQSIQSKFQLQGTSRTNKSSEFKDLEKDVREASIEYQ